MYPWPDILTYLYIGTGMVSYKNLLQEHMQKKGLTLPHYETERVEEGFKSTVKVHRQGNKSMTFTSSPQPVKKGAEQEAAKAACFELNLIQWSTPLFYATLYACSYSFALCIRVY